MDDKMTVSRIWARNKEPDFGIGITDPEIGLIVERGNGYQVYRVKYSEPMLNRDDTRPIIAAVLRELARSLELTAGYPLSNVRHGLSSETPGDQASNSNDV